MRNGILNEYILSSHDVSDGGLSVGLSECCILSSKGANIELSTIKDREDNFLFAEGGSRIIFSIDSKQESNWIKYLNEEIKNFSQTIYLKKLGYVSNKYCLLYTSDAADE